MNDQSNQNFAITTLESELRAMEKEEAATRKIDEPRSIAAAKAAADIRWGVAVLRAAVNGPIWPLPGGSLPDVTGLSVVAGSRLPE